MENYKRLIISDMLEIKNALQALEHLSHDKIMNQKIAFLTGDNDTSLFIIELDYHQTLPSHYHKKDIEIYYILSGEATVITEVYGEEKITDKLSQTVKKGDSFSVYPFQIHKVTNLHPEKLQILAIGPKSHNGDDRYFVEL